MGARAGAITVASSSRPGASAVRKAAANASAEANRSAGARAIARATTASRAAGMPACMSDARGAGFDSTACMMVAIPPSNGRLPVSNWNSTTPAEYRSVRWSIATP